jgi:hypothetical protein
MTSAMSVSTIALILIVAVILRGIGVIHQIGRLLS